MSVASRYRKRDTGEKVKSYAGIECPKCLGPTAVIQTFNFGTFIRRVRQCLDEDCFHTFKTTETRDKEED